MSMTLREFAAKGGKARAKALTKDRRIEIAKLAGQASALQRQLASKQLKGQVTESSENK